MPSPPPPDAREHALATSYELTEKRARVELEEVKARTAADDLRSRLDVSAYVQARGLGNREVSPAFQQIRGLEAWSAHIDLTYEMALDGTRQHAERTRAELAIASARQTFEETKRRVVKDLEDAMANSEAAQRRLELAGATFSIAEQKLTSKVQGFRTGSSTAFEVRDAENDVRDAELRRMRAHVDWVQADLAIAHLSGRLLGRYRNSP